MKPDAIMPQISNCSNCLSQYPTQTTFEIFYERLKTIEGLRGTVYVAKGASEWDEQLRQSQSHTIISCRNSYESDQALSALPSH